MDQTGGSGSASRRLLFLAAQNGVYLIQKCCVLWAMHVAVESDAVPRHDVALSSYVCVAVHLVVGLKIAIDSAWRCEK